MRRLPSFAQRREVCSTIAIRNSTGDVNQRLRLLANGNRGNYRVRKSVNGNDGILILETYIHTTPVCRPPDPVGQITGFNARLQPRDFTRRKIYAVFAPDSYVGEFALRVLDERDVICNWACLERSEDGNGGSAL